MMTRARVRVRTETLVIPTYLPGRPDQNPMFLENRVYQGSSGRVYPLPFTDRVAETKTDRPWIAVWLENEYLRVLVLPELGGRVHALQDKSNGYDLIYRQPVIKPALVGLAGPWISGGIEFNWPQHHRPATFLPVDFEIEDHPDGSKTLWCSDHDPLLRMKGMHGVCLHPDKACLEVKVRAYNRTPFVQTFLWWANVATRVHEGYQSFFPPDVHFVADHAKRAISEYPLAQASYYGVDYGARAAQGVPPPDCPSRFIPRHCGGTNSAHYAPNDLSWYANIPTPCSYMAMGSKQDFFGGYDHFRQAGLVHVANHHIAPGKKQWTWGNHPFGYAWDRNLTEADARGEFAPYIELMAGVYTDNQPDFSFLGPGETKTWSQYWYPIQRIGPPQSANQEAAVSLRVVREGNRLSAHFGVAVTRSHQRAMVTLLARGNCVKAFRGRLSPSEPLVTSACLPPGVKETDLRIEVKTPGGGQLISYAPISTTDPGASNSGGETRPSTAAKRAAAAAPASEPPSPAATATADELYLIGLHLAQYRHATRSPAPYWQEALRRDPLDSRCNNAMGLWHLRRGEFALAEEHLRKAIQRLTSRNPNPYDGEAYYNLGQCLRYRLEALGRAESNLSEALISEAYASFYKATWNQPWAAAGFHALAELDCRCCRWGEALEHLNRSLNFNLENTQARDLKAMVLRKLGRNSDAKALLVETRTLDRLDWWARYLLGEPLLCDLQTSLDVSLDLARAGLYPEAIDLLVAAEAMIVSSARKKAMRRRPSSSDLPDQNWGARPMLYFYRGWMQEQLGHAKAAQRQYRRAAREAPDYCFPARLEEISILESAIRAEPKDALAPYYLGNLLYDRRRQREAIRLWERSAKLNPASSVVWRNLGLGYFNVLKAPDKARTAYDKAVRADKSDARLLFERDQLWKRLGRPPLDRLRTLGRHLDLVRRRDDLSVELCSLYNQTGQHAKALEVLRHRQFQPWEGGEGLALGQHVRTHIALGRHALDTGRFWEAQDHFEQAMASPENLGEAKHLLANQGDIQYWLGVALDQLGEHQHASDHWRAAALFKGDFQEMSTRAYSELTYYSALSLRRLGQTAQARQLFRQLLAHAQRLGKTRAKIDYFATSLPTMLLFEDDLQFRQETTALFIEAQARLGLGQSTKARHLLKQVLRRDPNHALAADLSGSFHKPSSRSLNRPNPPIPHSTA